MEKVKKNPKQIAAASAAPAIHKASPAAPLAAKAPATKAKAPSLAASIATSVPKPGVDDISANIEKAKKQLEDLAAEHASRTAEIAKEEEEIAIAAFSEARSEETAMFHQQLTWEQGYLKNLEGEAGPAAEARRAEHENHIK